MQKTVFQEPKGRLSQCDMPSFTKWPVSTNCVIYFVLIAILINFALQNIVSSHVIMYQGNNVPMCPETCRDISLYKKARVWSLVAIC